MSRNIHNIELSPQKEYELDCPYCEQSFFVKKKMVQSAIAHKQSTMFCSSKCAHAERRISKDELAHRILTFYFDKGKVPTISDFKNTKLYSINFGSWKRAISYCGLDGIQKIIAKENRNTWERQYTRHRKIKKILIERLGGACQNCGYNRNLAVLQFHHIDPETKEISLDARSMGNVSLDRLEKEIQKCKLLCANCHIEHHNPHLNLVPVSRVELE